MALLGLVAAYAIGRKLAGVWGAFGAAALLAITAPWPVQAARVQADTASVALALCAVAVAFYAGRCSWRWAATGVLAGAAIAVKLLALPVVAPLAVLLIARRSWRAAGAALAGALAVWAVLLVAYAGALGELWGSVVADHRDARGLGPSLADNVERVLLHPLDWRTPAGVLVPIGLVAAVVLLRRLELLALGAWIADIGGVSRSPSSRCSITTSSCSPPRSPCPPGPASARPSSRAPVRRATPSPASQRLRSRSAFAQEERRLWRQDGDPPGVTWAAEQLRQRTEPDELVGTDLPIVAYLADRRVPGQLVDTSFVRLGTGSLTDAEILEELDGVRAVVVGRELAEQAGADSRALRARYPERVEQRRRHDLSRSLSFSSRIASRCASVTFWSTSFEIAVE